MRESGKSSLHNALEGLALTATLQSFPTFAAAAFLLKLVGNHDLVGDPGVAIFVAITDSSSTMVMSWSEATGWVRHAVILSASDRWASKNLGS